MYTKFFLVERIFGEGQSGYLGVVIGAVYQLRLLAIRTPEVCGQNLPFQSSWFVIHTHTYIQITDEKKILKKKINFFRTSDSTGGNC